MIQCVDEVGIDALYHYRIYIYAFTQESEAFIINDP